MIDGVVEGEEEAIFVAQTEGFQSRRKTARALLQLRVGERAFGIRECDLVAATARDIAVDEIGGGVVRPSLQDVFEHR